MKIANAYKGQLKTPSNIWDVAFCTKSLLASKANLQSCKTSKMELFAKIVRKKPFTVLGRTSILGVWSGSEYASALALKVKDVSFLDQCEYQMQQTTFY